MKQSELDNIILAMSSLGIVYAETTCDFNMRTDPDVLRRKEEYIMLRNIIYSLQDYDIEAGIITDEQIDYLCELATLILEKCPNIASSHKQGTWSFTLPPPVALPATNIDYFSFDANWEELEGVTGYLLDVSAFPDFSVMLAGYDGLDVGTALTYSVVDLDYDTDYYYRLRAVYDADISSNSNTIDVTTAILAAPVAIEATDITYEEFVANWEAVADATGYYLDVSIDPNFGSFLPGFEYLDVGDVLTYNVPDLDDDVTYYYRLRAYTTEMVSNDSNIIDVTTVEIYSACSDYEPYFEDPPVDNSMFLSCGVMKLATGTIGDYFIEWHLGSNSGTIVFTSGETIDPGEVQVQHPFVDEVVFAGTLYPVIKYVYINAIKYSAYYNGVDRYSPSFLSCLDFTNNIPGTVIIDAIECETLLHSNTLYNYFLTYTNNIDLSDDKSRTLKYNICGPDMKYLAVEFNAYAVSDQLKIYYCTLIDTVGILLDNWIHGSRNAEGNPLTGNLYPSNYPTNPRIAIYGITGTSPLCFITNISGYTYTIGDYLRIEITGAVYETDNSNTNWYIKLQSLTSIAEEFIFDTGINKIADTPVISYLTDPDCRYEISYNTTDDLDEVNLPQRAHVGVPDLYKYLWFYMTIFSNPSNYSFINPVKLGMNWKAVGTHSGLFSNTGWNTRSNLDSGETISVQKTGDDYIFTFTDVDDYNAMKSQMVLLKEHSSYITWLGLTDTDYRYYMRVYMQLSVAESDGDTGYPLWFFLFIGDTITYDDVNKKITWTCQVPTNNFPDPGDCNDIDNVVLYACNSMTGTKNAANFGPIHTHVRMNGWFYSTWPGYYEDRYETHEFEMATVIQDCFVDGIVDMEALGFIKGIYYAPSYPNMWILPRYWDKVTFTDITDHASRLANWRLERKKFLRTDDPADTEFETVHEEP